MRISDCSSDVCSSDLRQQHPRPRREAEVQHIVEQPRRKAEAQLDANRVHQRHRHAHQQCVDRIEQWRDEHEGEFDRLGHPGQEAGEGEAEEHRSEEHTSELQSLMRISYAVFCLKKKKKTHKKTTVTNRTTKYRESTT